MGDLITFFDRRNNVVDVTNVAEGVDSDKAFAEAKVVFPEFRVELTRI
jgi:hypothetical protein